MATDVRPTTPPITLLSQRAPAKQDPHPKDKLAVGLLPEPATLPAAPITDRTVQKDPAVNPGVAKVFTTTMGLQLGDNRVIPIALSKEKSALYQQSLDTAGQALKTQIEVYLSGADIAHAVPGQDLVTWYRYDPQTRSIVYQIRNEEREYHISFKQIQKQQGKNGYDAKPFIDAMLKFDDALSAIHSITVKFVQYADTRVTLLSGPSPFDKSKDPALKQLADKSFEQALGIVNQRLSRKQIASNPDVAENFKDLKAALEEQLTHAKSGGRTAIAKLLEALLQDIEAMDGFAVGLAAALTIVPKDYEAAVQLKDQIHALVPADQYTADIFGLYLQNHWDEGEEARLQSMYSEVALSLRASKTRASTEHGLLAYLKSRDLNKLKEFLVQRFASVGTQAGEQGATEIQEICDELEPDELPEDGSEADLP